MLLVVTKGVTVEGADSSPPLVEVLLNELVWSTNFVLLCVLPPVPFTVSTAVGAPGSLTVPTESSTGNPELLEACPGGVTLVIAGGSPCPLQQPLVS